jgi:hypothetical protein
MGKRKGRQSDSVYSVMTREAFLEIYRRRNTLDSDTRLRVEKEAKHRRIRNVQKERSS